MQKGRNGGREGGRGKGREGRYGHYLPLSANMVWQLEEASVAQQAGPELHANDAKDEEDKEA